jgi:hypothetical protein
LKPRNLIAAFVIVGVASFGGVLAVRADVVNPNNNNAGPSGPGVAATAHGMPQTAQVMFAVVNSNGTLARSWPITGTTIQHIATGQYGVSFYENVTGCAFLATVGQPGVGSTQGVVANVAALSGNVKGVFVDTSLATTGALVDAPFHLQVDC